MGKLEQESKKRRKRNQMTALVLSSVKAAGLIGTALVAPNVIGAMVKMGIISTRRDAELVKRTVDRLYDKGYLKHTGGKLALTPEGSVQLHKLDRKFRTWLPPKRWDKRWRVLVFDIPEAKKSLRDRIRRTLESIGFQQLQRSVWVYPYDCEDLMALLKADLKIGAAVLYMVVEHIENDKHLLEHFALD